MLPTQFSTQPTYFQPSQLPKNPRILNVLLQLENDNKSKDTIKNVKKFLKLIDRITDIDNPEHVKQFIARHQVSNSTKESISYAYRKYCKYHKIDAKLPYYKHDPKPIHVPTKEKLNIIISNASRLMTTKLRLSMETGLRPIEVHTLKVKDIDTDQRLVYPTTAKHGAPRTLKISPTLTTMIQEHIIAKKLKPEDKLFKGYTRQYSKNYRHLRNRLAEKPHDPTLRTI